MFHPLAGVPPISGLYLADTKFEVSIMQRLCTWGWGVLLLLATSSHADTFAKTSARSAAPEASAPHRPPERAAHIRHVQQVRWRLRQ